MLDENSRNVEEIIISPEKKRRNIKISKDKYYKIKHYKISKLLNDSVVSKFVTRKLIEVNDLSSGKYSVNKYITFKTSMLKSDLCHYSDAYFLKENISATGTNNVNRRNKKVTFKKNRKKIRPLDFEKKVIAQP